MAPERLGPVWAALAVAVVVSVTVMAVGGVRAGGFLLGGALLLASAGRGLLPADNVMALSVRGRWFDVALYAVFGLAVLIIVGTVKLA
ncbi:DUF3017 domain-containing protein [Demetria terragena]|uniref:DUF3017 domain-containing protein n=1 Tax=Demetria terragena TaxID=63959 RepID=UPI00036CB577|nr:DUF3017 domain-containing protein [Demetria terragena]